MPKYLLNSKPRRKMVCMHLFDTFSFFILAIILGGLEYRGGT